MARHRETRRQIGARAIDAEQLEDQPQRALARLIVLENTAKRRLHGRAELAQLHKTGADAQVQAHAHQQDHGGNAPDKVIDRIVDAFNQCQHEIPLPCEISESNSTFLICRAAMLNPAQALEIQ